MLPQSAALRRTPALPPVLPWAPAMQADAMPAGRRAMLEAIEALQPHRVLVMGEDALEILCALIRIGCDAAGELPRSERAEPHCADMVVAIVPKARPDLEHLLNQARRALVPGGSTVMQVTGPAAEPRAQQAALLLRRAGFAYARVTAAPGAAIVVARLAGPGDAQAAIHA